MIERKYERAFEGDRVSRTAGRAGFESCESYEERHDHILRAGTRVIAREGYQKASMRAVAKAAGVSLANIYHYFDSKEKILFVIQFRTFNSLLTTIQEKLHGVDDPIEQLRAMVQAHVVYFASHMEELRVCSHELDSLTGRAYDELRRTRLDYYRFARSIIDRILDACTAEEGLDRHAATMTLFGSLNWLYRWYDPSKDRSPTSLANQISTQFLQGIVGPTRTSASGSSEASHSDMDTVRFAERGNQE